jgi:hypothetical protein
MQTTADRYSIGAALLAAITSLTVWTTLTNKPDWKAQLAVSVMALATAAVATFPRVRHYAEAAGKARELATQYGGLTGPSRQLPPAPRKAMVNAATSASPTTCSLTHMTSPEGGARSQSRSCSRGASRSFRLFRRG